MRGQRGGRWARVFAAVAVMALLATCGDDGDEPQRTQSDRYTIAFLRAVRSSQPENQQAFLAELAESGYSEDTNLELIAKDLDEVYPDNAQAEAAVRRWVTAGVDLIVALATSSAQVAMAAAPDADVLFLVNDPVSAGLVTDLRRPDGNATGVTFAVPADRTLDVIRRAFGDDITVGLVYPPADPAANGVVADAIKASEALGIRLESATFTGAEDAASAVETVVGRGAEVLWLSNTPTTIRYVEPLAGAARTASLPVVANTVVSSAVVTLQPNTMELYRQIARQAIRLFEGDPISTVPVENPSRFVLEVNLIEASAVGATVDESVTEAADRVVR